jgi:putative hydrolase of the HAD superfamily
MHHMKPEPEAYATAIRKLALPPGEIVFIDDRPDMVAAGERMGMQGLIGVDPDQIVRDTTRLVREQNGVDV